MAVDAKPLVLPDRPRGSRWDYALLATMAALPVLAGIAKAPAALTVALAVAALVALQWCVRRRGGWRLIGPHAYYDLIRMSRKGRVALLRTVFLLALLAAIWHAHDAFTQQHALRHAIRGELGGFGPGNAAVLRDALARFNSQCAYRWFLLQNVTILVLTPVYVGGAVAEERERGTLELLLTSGLLNCEIVLGKLLARLMHLGMFLVAGLPIFSIMLVWGGIDLRLLLASWMNSALLLLAMASVCLMISTMPVRATTAVIISYAIVVPGGACCLWGSDTALTELLFSGVAPRLGATIVLGGAYAFTIPFCLLIAVAAVRLPEGPPDPAGAAPWNPWVGPTAPVTDQAQQRLPSLVPIVARTATELGLGVARRRTLPPVGDNALLWKERYTGDRSLLLTSEVMVLITLAAAPMIIPVFLASIVIILERSHGSLFGLLHSAAYTWSGGLRAGYVLCLGGYCLGVAFRAAGCVVRERQMRTLDMLLQLPIEPAEILRVKWLVALFKGWPWLALLLVDLAIGLVIGAFHPFSFLFMLAFPVPLILALCSVGSLISAIARTTAQANLAMACVLLALAICCGWARPMLFLGDSAFVCTRWQTPPVQWRDLYAFGISAALLIVAGTVRALGGWVFARR